MAILLTAAVARPAMAQRQMEYLGRGVVAVHQRAGEVFVSWRMLATDPDKIAFNVYRAAGKGEAVKLNEQPVGGATCFTDRNADLAQSNSYFVRAVVDGGEQQPSRATLLPANPPQRAWLSIPLETPEGYTPNDASVGDLDGDGEYEIVLHQASRGRDNSQAGATEPPLLEAYTLAGRRLWRINLGRNIREGAHYTQFMVYDLDGDGRAEVACKTADGAVDGLGTTIGDADADYRNPRGYVLDGPEFLTIFDGRSGAALATAPYVPPRGKVADWGDDYGNRVDRFLACIAYLDGQRPSLVMCRGYYTRTVLAAWNWRDGRLTNSWTFDSHDGTPGNRAYAGQGNHNLSVGDVDGDGKDEIIYGACAIDDDGRGLHTTRLGHGDALHLSDLDPDRPGLEVFDIHEHPRHEHGIEFRDARTGETLWSKPSADVGRGVAMDIDPRHRGYECWAAGPGLDRLYDCRGREISAKPRACNMGVWWDGDLLRELLDGVRIEKWDYERGQARLLVNAADDDCAANNGSKANPCLVADLFGDWREEVIWRSRDNRELRIFSTTAPTERRMVTLMHDPLYRLSVAWQNVGYNQPTQVGFYLGEGMSPPPRPAIRTVRH
ncbi:MAG TPA: rhamnogalacturonan lyase [Pirellulales bacterium]|nr:rhamnogalacturonan lyase [Pirellulales bacterium]